mgnify:CR=1 FL=1
MLAVLHNLLRPTVYPSGVRNDTLSVAVVSHTAVGLALLATASLSRRLMPMRPRSRHKGHVGWDVIVSLFYFRGGKGWLPAGLGCSELLSLTFALHLRAATRRHFTLSHLQDVAS